MPLNLQNDTHSLYSEANNHTNYLFLSAHVTIQLHDRTNQHAARLATESHAHIRALESEVAVLKNTAATASAREETAARHSRQQVLTNPVLSLHS